MQVTAVRLPVVQRADLDALAAATGRDRSTVVRAMIADGLRRGWSARKHPALLPDDLRPPARPAAARDPHQEEDRRARRAR